VLAYPEKPRRISVWRMAWQTDQTEGHGSWWDSRGWVRWIAQCYKGEEPRRRVWVESGDGTKEEVE